MTVEDLEQYELVEPGLSESELEERVQNYFSKAQKQITAIQRGMDAVLQGKFSSLAYVPLDQFI